jgi:hypothetical protein
MPLLTVSEQLVESLERHSAYLGDSADLLHAVRAECPSASTRDMVRAAFYAATDPYPADQQVTVRLFTLAMQLRREM